jgi:hypothetical protein
VPATVWPPVWITPTCPSHVPPPLLLLLLALPPVELLLLALPLVGLLLLALPLVGLLLELALPLVELLIAALEALLLVEPEPPLDVEAEVLPVEQPADRPIQTGAIASTMIRLAIVAPLSMRSPTRKIAYHRRAASV